MSSWDTLIVDALVFDGSGAAPRRVDVALSEGQVARVGPQLDRSRASEVVSGENQWLTPGLLDIHTHFDLEVELAPGLGEAVRHGTTTVVMSNCSLGLAFGNQRKQAGPYLQDPIVDCFARVENMPKHVLRKAANLATWRDSGEYLRHLDGLALGPNVVPMIPHSMLRVEVMGLDAAVTRDPTPEELDEMVRLLEKGLAEGYVGFSTDALPFHYLANDPHRQKKIPSQHLSQAELRRLTDALRRHDRVWQATPPKDDPLLVLRSFLLTSGRLFGQPLRLTAVAALDVVTNRSLAALGLVMTRLFNSPLLQGRFRLQALAAPFEVWSEGPLTPLAEEIPELRELNEPDLEDVESRRRLLRDPDYRERFVRMWTRGRKGFSWARILRWLRRENVALTRELRDMKVAKAPVAEWVGETLHDVYERLRAHQMDAASPRSPGEAEAFADAPDLRSGPYVGNDALFLLYLLERFDTALVWSSITANDRPEKVKALLTHPQILPGFNDSGAHLTNMAFYDTNLRGLRMVMEDGFEAVSRHISRLTSEPADFFRLASVGRIAEGYRGDLVLIDPEALRHYDGRAHVREIHRDVFDHTQLVNRSDGVVTGVWIGGHRAWTGEDFTEELGETKMGDCLTTEGIRP
ncbi:MAG: N-acyl-D-glutamate deacylase [Myxococcota bacterium]